MCCSPGRNTSLKDNYFFGLVDGAARVAVLVDPADAEAAQRALKDVGCDLRHIWLTHHHSDHVAAVEPLCRAFAGIDVVASAAELARKRIAYQTRGIRDGDEFTCGNLRARVLALPGHTAGAVAYWVGEDLFVGDTLFVGGCGRVFEGTLAEMKASLDRIAALAPQTRIWCGHEYAVRSLEFGASVLPGERAIARALAHAREQVARGLPTVPSTVNAELEHNVFLRCAEPAIAQGRSPLRLPAAAARGHDASRDSLVG